MGRKALRGVLRENRKIQRRIRLSIVSRTTNPLWIPLPVILVLLIIKVMTCVDSKKDIKYIKYFFGKSDKNNIQKNNLLIEISFIFK